MHLAARRYRYRRSEIFDPRSLIAAPLGARICRIYVSIHNKTLIKLVSRSEGRISFFEDERVGEASRELGSIKGRIENRLRNRQQRREGEESFEGMWNFLERFARNRRSRKLSRLFRVIEFSSNGTKVLFESLCSGDGHSVRVPRPFVIHRVMAM